MGMNICVSRPDANSTHIIEQLCQFCERPLNTLNVLMTLLHFPVGCSRGRESRIQKRLLEDLPIALVVDHRLDLLWAGVRLDNLELTLHPLLILDTVLLLHTLVALDGFHELLFHNGSLQGRDR